MAVRFILGRAGSGKTTACLQEIAACSQREPLGPPTILLVPEQATFEMEKDLAALCGGGTFRAQILSFRRLAYHILSAGGRQPYLSDTGRQLVLRRLLQEQTTPLATFERAARQPRFCEQLALQLREFKHYQITPDTLDALASQADCPPELQGKLTDLAAIYSSYHNFTQGKYSDPEDVLTELAAAIEAGRLPAGTRIWIDGFAGFTPQEYAVLAAVMKHAAQVDIALCLDPTVIKIPREDELFYPTLDTYQRLSTIIAKMQLQLLEPLCLPQADQHTRFTTSAALAHLEAHYAVLPVPAYPQQAEAVKLVMAAGHRAEVEAVARDILHLVRERGLRYRDIAIILRNFSAYHDLVAAIFLDYDIPYYVDERRTATHHPLVELVRSALEAVLNHYQPESILQLLKTDLFPLQREAVDKMENVVRAYGIRGSRFLDHEPWDYHRKLTLDDNRELTMEETDDAYAIHNAKNVFGELFAPFAHAVSNGGKQTAADYCYALWQLLERLNVSGELQAWSDAAEKEGKLAQAMEHRQVYSAVIELLEQTHDVIGEQKLTLQEFTQVILSGLESLKLGLIPATTDRVIIGNVERSRQPRLRAAYVLGLNEGDFPARLEEEGLFADSERESMEQAGVELAVTRRQRLFQEQYLSYIALTRSSEYLWVSCVLADDEGKAKRPSSLFNRVREVFAENDVTFFANTADNTEDYHVLAHPRHVAAQLLLQAGQILRGGALSPFWGAVYQQALETPGVFTDLHKLWPALTYDNFIPSLSKDAVEAVFGTTIKSSVSRMETFAQCAFAHFAQFGLRLREREDFSIEAPEMGSFFHTALRLFVEQLKDEEILWSELSVTEAQEKMAAIVATLVPQLNREILLSSARLRYLAKRLQETLASAVASLTLHAQQSKFNPIAAELSFGSKPLPAWHLQGDDLDVELFGQVDRIDAAISGDKTYLRVIDYKSSPTSLKLSDVWHGLSLQLLAYLAVIDEAKDLFNAKDAACVGALYFGIYRPYERVDNPLPDSLSEKPVKLEGLFIADQEIFELMGGDSLVHASLKKDGSFTKTSRVVDSHQLQLLMNFTRTKMLELAACIKNGVIEAAPYKKPDGKRACTYCPYLPVCCFDVTVAKNQYRLVPTYGSEAVLQSIARQQEGAEA